MAVRPQQNLKSGEVFERWETKINIIEIEINMTVRPQQNLKSEQTFQDWQTKIKII